MVSPRPGMCNRGGIDHHSSRAAVLCGLQGMLVCASSPRTTTQVEHDIVSWQVCPGGNLDSSCACA